MQDSLILKVSTMLLFLQEAEKLFLVDFPFVKERLVDDLKDDNLRTLVGDPLLRQLDAVSVGPIEAVRNLSEGIVQDNKC